MNDDDRIAMRILRDALDTDSRERGAFVDDRCAGDQGLRSRVTSLLPRAVEVEDELSPPDDATLDSVVGSRLGPFRIIERIGRGGMGVVYRGERDADDVQQTVAVKLIRRGFDFDDVQTRFLRERRILARLEHPNIARFIDGGVAADGRPWFALEFVRGESTPHACATDHR